MKTMKNLVVAGCSFSDYAEVKIPYGIHLSNHYNVDYIHLGAGCGSNYRIWRRVVGDILAGNITENSCVIIQYTENIRKEFYSRHTWPLSGQPIELRDPYGDGQLIRFKLGLVDCQQHKEESDFYRAIEDNFISEEYDAELFQVNHEMFKSFVKERNITPLFLKSNYNSINNEVSDNIIDIEWVHNPKYTISEEDISHLSEYGHKKLSEYLIPYIDNMYISGE